MGIGAIKPQRRGTLKLARPHVESIVERLPLFPGSEDFLTLKLEASNLTTIWSECSRIEKMITQSYSHRYYYYYGPLSIWRDGRPMGCRELIN